MAWSYSGNPGSSLKDEVRFLLQDTDDCEQLMSDGEIEYLLASEGSALKGAIRGIEILMTKYATWTDEKVGQVSVSFSQRVENLGKVLEQLRRRLGLRGAVPYAGGISVADKQSQEADGDRVSPSFTRHMHDIAVQTTEAEAEEDDAEDL